MRVAVIENTAVSHLGQVGVALAEAGAWIEIFQPWNGGSLPAGIAGHDALVVLGGEQNARADDSHPYLPDLAALMKAFGDAGKAVLGICLGSQILARAHGADNHIGTAPEFGWHDMQPTGDGAKDPVLQAAAGGFPIFEWHSDTFSLPAGAVHLAASAAVPHQAFRIGRASYGTQFHFEASTTVVDAWKTSFPELIDGIAPGWRDRHADLAISHGIAADAAGLAMARAWVALIEVETADAARVAAAG